MGKEITVLQTKKVKILNVEWDKLFRYYLKSEEGVKLNSLHLLILELIVEIKENNLRNTDNNNYFLRAIDALTENNDFVKNNLTTYLKFIKINLSQNRNDYVLEACNSIVEIFKSPQYFRGQVTTLSNLICDESEIDLNFYTLLKLTLETIINELVLKGYAMKDIESMGENIFASFSINSEGLFSTNFPIISGQYQVFNLETDEGIKQKEELENYFRHLTLSDRINSLNVYFDKEPLKCTYIFVIRGLKEIDTFKFFETEFYSPVNKQFNKWEEYVDFSEDLQQDIENFRYAQVALTCTYLSPESSLLSALDKLESHLDLLSSLISTKVPLMIDSSKWIALSEDGKLLYYSISSGQGTNSISDYHDSFDLDFNAHYIENSLQEKGLKSFQRLSNFLENRMLNALHWHRKGNEAKKDSDKLLFYWIAIENLFDSADNDFKNFLGKGKGFKIEIIREVLSSSLFKSELHAKAWNLYYHYKSNTHYIFKTIDIPEELLIASQLKSKIGGYVNLDVFVNNLLKIKEYEVDILMINKIDDVIKLFRDTKYQKAVATSIINEFSSDVLMIYRYRNLIVHNARYNALILPTYSQKAKQFSSVIINSILDKLDTGKSINQILLSFKQYKDWYLFELELDRNHIISNE